MGLRLDSTHSMLWKGSDMKSARICLRSAAGTVTKPPKSRNLTRHNCWPSVDTWLLTITTRNHLPATGATQIESVSGTSNAGESPAA